MRTVYVHVNDTCVVKRVKNLRETTCGTFRCRNPVPGRPDDC